MFRLTLKDKELAKKPYVKKYLREVEKRIKKHLADQHYEEKAFEAYNLGLPLIITEDGSIRVAKDA